jgi:hypothetical protein
MNKFIEGVKFNPEVKLNTSGFDSMKVKLNVVGGQNIK